MHDDPTAVDWRRCTGCRCSSAEIGRAGGCPFEYVKTMRLGAWSADLVPPERAEEQPEDDQSEPLSSDEARGLLLPALLAVALVVAMVSCVVRWPR